WGDASAEYLLVVVVIIGIVGSVWCLYRSYVDGDWGRGTICAISFVICDVATLAALLALIEGPGGGPFVHTTELICALMAGIGGFLGDAPRGRGGEPPK